MKEPWFWRNDSLAARATALALSPATLLYNAGQRVRAATTRPEDVGAPVICVGNATLGGTGKTPFALLLHGLLKERGLEAHFLSRGYGGALKGPARVNHQHTAAEAGDEPLLLAAAGPTWIARNRLDGARAAAKAGAAAIVMDDGFQNPTIRKAVAFLLIDAADPAGNGGVFPAGPLREPLQRAIARADALVLVGEGAFDFTGSAPPVFRAKRVIETSISPQKVVAFCGIGRPAQFFASLEAKGFALAARRVFPDHHAWRGAELSCLRAQAKEVGAALVTTEKDFVRMSAEEREGIDVARLSMTVDDPARLGDFVLSRIGAR